MFIIKIPQQNEELKDTEIYKKTKKFANLKYE